VGVVVEGGVALIAYAEDVEGVVVSRGAVESLGFVDEEMDVTSFEGVVVDQVVVAVVDYLIDHGLGGMDDIEDCSTVKDVLGSE
jgi:hypothetical protein